MKNSVKNIGITLLMLLALCSAFSFARNNDEMKYSAISHFDQQSLDKLKADLDNVLKKNNIPG
nr:hypothetical protein [Bacteroidota bacterium]